MHGMKQGRMTAMRWHATVVVALLTLPVQAALAQVTQARVTGGMVSGVVEDNIGVFKGIPFAAPPVGELRWKAPAPVQAWSGVKKADAFAHACMQPANSQGNTAPVSEDCLYLNVWTPARAPDAKVPVIVWIHGGGYVGGSTSIGMYNGAGYARKGVVLVSLAYRLGPYGFMAHPQLSRESGHGSGTWGIQDLIAGLKWVQQNIAAFGGDPGNVTIYGHSAGAGAVSFLAASPLTKGLFHRVIAMSGGSFAPLITSEQGGGGLSIPSLKVAEATGSAFLARLGVPGIAEARKLDADTIQAATGGGLSFRPAADGHVIAGDLYSLYQQGRFNDTPLLLGHTSDETLAFGGAGRTITPADFRAQVQTQFGAQAAAVLAAYPHATEAEAARAARLVRNDTQFNWNAWTWARQQTKHGKGAVYSYYYDNHGPQAEGAGHGSDVSFAFQTLGGRGPPTKSDQDLSGLISSYHVNFATTGDPNGRGLPRWPVFSDSNQVMVFDAAPGARTYPILDKVKVYDAYYERLRSEK
jgi:para-nitrobenzyl esterase